MDYYKIYSDFIADRKRNPSADLHSELHHIIPLSANGQNVDENLVRLSVRDHLFAHMLLAHIGICAGKTQFTTHVSSRELAIKKLSKLTGTLAGNDVIKKQVTWASNLYAKKKDKVNKWFDGNYFNLAREMLQSAQNFIESNNPDTVISITPADRNHIYTKIHDLLIQTIRPRMGIRVTAQISDGSDENQALSMNLVHPNQAPLVRRMHAQLSEEGLATPLRFELPNANIIFTRPAPVAKPAEPPVTSVEESTAKSAELQETGAEETAIGCAVTSKDGANDALLEYADSRTLNARLYEIIRRIYDAVYMDVYEHCTSYRKKSTQEVKDRMLDRIIAEHATLGLEKYERHAIAKRIDMDDRYARNFIFACMKKSIKKMFRTMKVKAND